MPKLDSSIFNSINLISPVHELFEPPASPEHVSHAQIALSPRKWIRIKRFSCRYILIQNSKRGTLKKKYFKFRYTNTVYEQVIQLSDILNYLSQ